MGLIRRIEGSPSGPESAVALRRPWRCLNRFRNRDLPGLISPNALRGILTTSLENHQDIALETYHLAENLRFG